MQSPEGLTELRCNGCFALEAPVLQSGEKFYEWKQLFTGGELQEVAVLAAIHGILE